MIKVIILVLFYFTFPLVIIWMCRRWTFFKKLGSIVVAYGCGLILSATGIIQNGSDEYQEALRGESFLSAEEVQELRESGIITADDIIVNTIVVTQDTLQAIGVLAFPLLLFSLNIRRWIKYAKEGFISMEECERWMMERFPGCFQCCKTIEYDADTEMYVCPRCGWKCTQEFVENIRECMEF